MPTPVFASFVQPLVQMKPEAAEELVPRWGQVGSVTVVVTVETTVKIHVHVFPRSEISRLSAKYHNPL